MRRCATLGRYTKHENTHNAPPLCAHCDCLDVVSSQCPPPRAQALDLVRCSSDGRAIAWAITRKFHRQLITINHISQRARCGQREGFRDIRTISVRYLCDICAISSRTSPVRPPYVRTISARYPHDIRAMRTSAVRPYGVCTASVRYLCGI